MFDHDLEGAIFNIADTVGAITLEIDPHNLDADDLQCSKAEDDVLAQSISIMQPNNTETPARKYSISMIDEARQEVSKALSSVSSVLRRISGSLPNFGSAQVPIEQDDN